MNEMFEELEERKRREFAASIGRGRVGDPITGAIAAIKLSSILISLAVSAATTAASYGLGRLLAPKPTGQEIGRLAPDDYTEHIA